MALLVVASPPKRKGGGEAAFDRSGVFGDKRGKESKGSLRERKANEVSPTHKALVLEGNSSAKVPLKSVSQN